MGVAASHADVFRAIADPTRRALLELLHGADCSVVELTKPFRMTRPAVSQHLRVLRQAGLVRAKRVGRERRYRLDPKPLHEVHAWAARFVVDPFGHVWSVRQRNV
jgi:DNA-binding transcriptional ArsR family regulator